MSVREEAIKKKFKRLTTQVIPKPNMLKKCTLAFLVGGIICDVGQFLTIYYSKMGLTPEDTNTWVSITMVFIGALLTGLGVYDKIANFAGAGSVVPITGFANSIVSPAMEFRKEGFIFGVGAKMFTIAGPVLVYGISTSVLIGILHYIFINL